MTVYEPRDVTLRDGRVVTLRSTRVEDAEAVIGYLDAMRRESGGVLFSPRDDLPTLEFERGWIAGRRDSQDAVQLGVWDASGLPIALAGVERETARVRNSHRANLGISVRRAWWRAGVGRLLMRELVDFCEAHPTIEVMHLTVWHCNLQAIALYESIGFRRGGLKHYSAKFEDGSYAHTLHMSRWVGDGPAPDVRERDPLVAEAAA
ncbi:MAG: GNAT family N-acetyltransferase [Planctomycetota bacterium]